MIITIGRQLAAGGREVGKQVAELLNLQYFDKELLLEAARRSGIADERFSLADEKYNLFTLALSTNNQRLFEFQAQTIRQLASECNCLILGRAADYILRDFPNLFSIFLSADIEQRARVVALQENISHDDAINFIEKTDRNRANYYNFYTGRHWGDSHYDLCINTSRFGINGTVQTILNAVKQSHKD